VTGLGVNKPVYQKSLSKSVIYDTFKDGRRAN